MGLWGRCSVTRETPACRGPPLNPASPLGFTLVVDHAAAVASRSAGAEGGAGSDDWEDVERNLG